MRENLKNYRGLDLLNDWLMLTIHSDRELFEGQSIDTVRGHFKKWVDSDEAAAELENRGARVGARYENCVHVYAASLESIVNNDHPYVNLVDGVIWRGSRLPGSIVAPFKTRGSVKVDLPSLFPSAYHSFQFDETWRMLPGSLDPLNIWSSGGVWELLWLERLHSSAPGTWAIDDEWGRERCRMSLWENLPRLLYP
jgi:hypothetical protein